MRGVTWTVLQAQRHSLFQLTRLMRGVTQINVANLTVDNISTHTPHARRDLNV